MIEVKDNKDQLINIGQLSIILDDCQLNGNKLKIHKHVYDYYNKITHAITDNNVDDASLTLVL